MKKAIVKDTKTKPVLFRLSKSEHERLVQAVGDLTLSAYLRAALLGQELQKVRVSKKPVKDYTQLSQALNLMMQSRLSPLAQH